MNESGRLSVTATYPGHFFRIHNSKVQAKDYPECREFRNIMN
jgi:hypothetical protein